VSEAEYYSARGLSADRRQKPLNQLTLPGSKLGAESHRRQAERCGAAPDLTARYNKMTFAQK